MHVPLTINDHIRRAELLYPDRGAVVDEPDQPAESWGSLTYRQVGERARAQAAGLDALGIGVGERVAMVSHNSARLLTSFFGVSGSGRILVPVNFRLVAEEVKYIIEHSGARVLGRGLWKGGDVALIDGAVVNGSARAVGGIAGVVRRVQTGLLSWYALAMVLGVFGLLTWQLWPYLFKA